MADPSFFNLATLKPELSHRSLKSELFLFPITVEKNLSVYGLCKSNRADFQL